MSSLLPPGTCLYFICCRMSLPSARLPSLTERTPTPSRYPRHHYIIPQDTLPARCLSSSSASRKQQPRHTRTHTWTRARFPIHAAVWMSVPARLRARPARSATALRTPSALQSPPPPPPPPPSSPGRASRPPPLSPIDRRTHQRTNYNGREASTFVGCFGRKSVEAQL